MWYIYNGILLSHRRVWNNAIGSNMDGLEIVIVEWSQTEKDKYHMVSLMCDILKNGKNELIYKTESQMYKTNMVAKGEGGKDKVGDWGLTYSHY